MSSVNFLLNEESGRNEFSKLITQACEKAGAKVARIETDGNITLEISHSDISATVRVWKMSTGPLSIEWAKLDAKQGSNPDEKISLERTICDDQAQLIELLLAGLNRDQLKT